MKNQKIHQMVLIGVMSAISVVLNYYSFDLGTMKITLYALPIMIIGMLFGPLMGLSCGLISGFIIQLTSKYGLSLTTPLWMLAPILWGLISGFIMKLFKKDYKWYKVGINVIITSLFVLIVNSFVMILDGLIFEYETEYVFLQIGYRILTSLVTSIIYSAALFIICNRLKPIIKER